MVSHGVGAGIGIGAPVVPGQCFQKKWRACSPRIPIGFSGRAPNPAATPVILRAAGHTRRLVLADHEGSRLGRRRAIPPGLERFSLRSGVWCASAAAAPSPCRCAAVPLPYRARGASHHRPPCEGSCEGSRSGAGWEGVSDWEFYLSRYGRGGEPERAGEGADPEPLRIDLQTALIMIYTRDADRLSRLPVYFRTLNVRLASDATPVDVLIEDYLRSLKTTRRLHQYST